MQCGENTFEPSKIVCVGRNYVKHIEELNNEFPEHMVLFQKSPDVVSDTLITPLQSCRFEAEVTLLLYREKLIGIGAGLDLTLDKEQAYLKSKGLPWERAKNFKNSACFTKFIPFSDDAALGKLELKLFKNETLQQHAKSPLMIYSYQKIIKQSQEVFGLPEYTLIMTGTPEGVESFECGDSFRFELIADAKTLLEQTVVAQ